MTTTKEALEPCWCRPDTEYLRVKAHMDHGEFGCRERGRYVYCPNCWACGPTYNTDAEAINGWNNSRRVSAPIVAPEVDDASLTEYVLGFCPEKGRGNAILSVEGELTLLGKNLVRGLAARIAFAAGKFPDLRHWQPVSEPAPASTVAPLQSDERVRKLTLPELNHLSALLEAERESGSYAGPREQYYARTERLIKWCNEQIGEKGNGAISNR